MYGFLNDLLSDKKGSIVFSCFGLWHLIYLAVIALTVLCCALFLKNKSEKTTKRAANAAIGTAFGLYIADFFLMPFAYGEIDPEKLPFHICTAMCVMCFLSRHSRVLEKWKTQFALLGLISNLIYLIYPAGIGWYQIHPLSYRVIQTLLFHGSMTAYGLFCLLFEKADLRPKNCCKDLAVIIGMTLWALLGNALYNHGTYGGKTRFFNWFFVIRDPFYLLPEHFAPYLMPFIMVTVFFLVDLAVYAVYNLTKKHLRHSLHERMGE